MEKQKAIEIPASERYDSPYSGEQETDILQHAEKLKDQTAASDGDTVQVYDVDGNPHKVAKSELLKKSTLALPNLSDISKFVAVNAKGDAIGLMTKEQVAQVLGELIGSVSENKDGLMPHKGFILRRSVPDLNTMDSGFARVDSDTANLPNGLAWKYGIAVTFRTDNVAAQLFFSSESGFFIRVLWDSWLEWIRL